MDNKFDESLLSAQLDAARDLSNPTWKSLRPLGWASIILGVLWIYGFGSLFAIGFGAMGFISRYRVPSKTYPPPGMRLCVTGMAIGVIGLAVVLIR